MRFVRGLIYLLILILLVLIGVQNYQTVSQELVFKLDLGFLGTWQIGPVSVGVLFILALLLGGLFVGVYGFGEYLRLRRKYKEALRRSKHEGAEPHEGGVSGEALPLSAEPLEEDES